MLLSLSIIWLDILIWFFCFCLQSLLSSSWCGIEECFSITLDIFDTEHKKADYWSTNFNVKWDCYNTACFFLGARDWCRWIVSLIYRWRMKKCHDFQPISIIRYWFRLGFAQHFWSPPSIYNTSAWGAISFCFSMCVPDIYLSWKCHQFKLYQLVNWPNEHIARHLDVILLHWLFGSNLCH